MVALSDSIDNYFPFYHDYFFIKTKEIIGKFEIIKVEAITKMFIKDIQGGISF